MDFNPAPKPVCTIKRWAVAFCDNPPSYILMGNLYGHPQRKDGHFAMTSPLITIDFVNKIAETSNGFYKLEDLKTN